MANNQNPNKDDSKGLVNAVNPKLESLSGELSREYNQAVQDRRAKTITQKQFEQRTGSIAKRIGGQINTIANESSMEALITKSITSNDSFRTMAQSRKDLMSMSTSALQESVRRSTALASMEAGSLASMTIQSRPNGSDGFQGDFGEKSAERRARIGHLVQEAGLAKVAIRLQNRLGTSSEKEDQLYDAMSNKTSSLKEKRDLQRLLKDRKIGSYQEELGKLNTKQASFEDAFSKKITAQESLSVASEAKSEAEAREKAARAMYESDSSEKNKKALEQASQSVRDFAAELDKAAKETEEASKAFKEATKDLEEQQKITAVAQDSGAGGGKLKSYAQATSIMANEIQYNLVDQKLRAQQVRSSIAQYGLMQYNRAFAATQGDMQSLFEISLSDQTSKFGNSVYNSQLGATVALEKAKATEAVANIVTGVKGADASKVLGGIGTLGGQFVRNVGENRDYEILAAEKQMEGKQIQNQLNSALAAFRAKGTQRTFDQFMGALPAIVGSGSQVLEGKLTDIDSIRNASSRGNLSPEELLAVSAQVNESVRGSRNDRYDVAIRAGELQKGRAMSSSQYIQAMSAQANIGGTQGGLESNLRRAFAAGINDSKLLTEFVELNAGLNQGLADIGIALEANNAFANKVQELVSKGVPESLASRAASNSISGVDNYLSSLKLGPGAIAKSAAMQNTWRSVFNKPMTDAQMAAYSQMSQEMRQIAFGEQELNQGQIDELNPGDRSLYLDARKAGKTGRRALRAGDKAANYAGFLGDVGGEKELGGTILRLPYSFVDKGTTSLEAPNEANIPLRPGMQEAAKEAGNEAKIKEIQDAMKMFNAPDTKTLMDTVVKEMQKQSEQISIKKTEESVQKQITEMKSEEMFSSAVKEFGQWVTILKNGEARKDPVLEAKIRNEKKQEYEQNSSKYATARKGSY